MTVAICHFYVQLYSFEDRGKRRVALRPELTPSLARLVIQKGYGECRFYGIVLLMFFKMKASCFCVKNLIFYSAKTFWYSFIYFVIILYPGTDARIWSQCFFWFRKSLSLPLKWFAVGQCWRYERMTRGRRREHYQWNMDILGVSEVTVCAATLICFMNY